MVCDARDARVEGAIYAVLRVCRIPCGLSAWDISGKALGVLNGTDMERIEPVLKGSGLFAFCPWTQTWILDDEPARKRLEEYQHGLLIAEARVGRYRRTDLVGAPNIIEVVQRWAAREPTDRDGHKNGAVYRVERLAAVAKLCTDLWEGDLVEIGCYMGDVSQHLARVAKAAGRSFVAIDPWKVGTQDCRGGEYEVFIRRVNPYLDVCNIWRSPSQDADVVEMLAGLKMCFVLVDGLHSYDGCLADIRAVKGCGGVIAVDDIWWQPLQKVRRAFLDGAFEIGRDAFAPRYAREGYLI